MIRELFNTAGNFAQEMEDASLEAITGGVGEERAISKGNDGKHCTITWECSICPTLTCFC